MIDPKGEVDVRPSPERAVMTGISKPRARVPRVTADLKEAVGVMLF